MSNARTIIIMFLAVSTIAIIFWTRDSRKISKISKDFNESNIVNAYSVEDCTYGIFLSDNESVYYQYKIDSEYFYINFMDDRSYSYQDFESGTIFDDNNDEPRYQFLYNVSSNSLSQVVENELFLINSELNDDVDILLVVEYVHHYLGHDSSLIVVSDLYEIINELLDLGVKHGTNTIIGNADTVGLSLTVSTDTFVKNITKFDSHLKIIYGVEKAELIIESILDSLYDDVHIILRWNDKEDIITPYLGISFKNIKYYEISVFPSDFISYDSLNDFQ